MTGRATLIIAALFWSTAAAAPEQVTCHSPCDCHDAHGEGRWSVKTDASLPPTDASAIQAVTPSEMFSWPGPDAAITMQSEWNATSPRARACATRGEKSRLTRGVLFHPGSSPRSRRRVAAHFEQMRPLHPMTN